MITKAIGIKSAELTEDPTGNPGSRLLRIVTENGGEVQINLTVAELRRLITVLAGDSWEIKIPERSFRIRNEPPLDATGFQLGDRHFGKASLPR
jgi:hypothetical protein